MSLAYYLVYFLCDYRLTVSQNAVGAAYGILQGFCNFSQTVFPIFIGQLVDRAPSKMEGFYRVFACLLLLTVFSIFLIVLLLKNDQRYFLQSKCEDPKEFETILQRAHSNAKRPYIDLNKHL